MTLEEAREIKRRLEWLGASTLSMDIRLDSASLWKHPEFYYFRAQLKMGEKDNEDVLVELFINEDPEVEEVRLEKSDSRFIDDKYLPAQQEFYYACKPIVGDYLHGNLVENEVKEWNEQRKNI